MGLAFKEGFLSSRSTDAVDGLAGVRQPQAEHGAGRQLATKSDYNFAESAFGLTPGQVGLRDERVGGLATGFDADLAAAGGDVVAHHPVQNNPGCVVLVQESVEDALRGVALFPRRVQVVSQPAVDDLSVRVEAGSAFRWWFRLLWPCRL